MLINKKSLQWVKNDRGFTLVEMVLSWVVIGIIFLSFAVLLRLTVNSFSMVNSRKEALAHARLAMDRMTKELISLKTSDIISISSTSLNFTDGDGLNTDYHWTAAGGAAPLYRGTDLLAKDLSSFVLSYYDNAGTLITNYADVASVRRINIEFYVAAKNGNGSVGVKEDIFPRNFYYTGFQ